MTPDDLRKIFDVNVFGVVYCLQAAAEKMIAQGTGGKIINAASIAGHSRLRLLGHYSRHEVRRPRADPGRGQGAGPAQDHGQRLLPGDRRHRHVGPHRREDGPLPGHREGEALAQYSQLIALGRVQTPEDVAGFVSYLAGPDSDYMTGQSVMIDGGIVMV